MNEMDGVKVITKEWLRTASLDLKFPNHNFLLQLSEHKKCMVSYKCKQLSNFLFVNVEKGPKRNCIWIQLFEIIHFVFLFSTWRKSAYESKDNRALQSPQKRVKCEPERKKDVLQNVFEIFCTNSTLIQFKSHVIQLTMTCDFC